MRPPADSCSPSGHRRFTQPRGPCSLRRSPVGFLELAEQQAAGHAADADLLERTLTDLVHSVPLGLLVTDSAGIVRLANATAADAFAVAESDLLGQPLSGLGEVGHGFAQLATRAVSGRQTLRGVAPVHGGRRAAAAISPLGSASGSSLAVVIVLEVEEG